MIKEILCKSLMFQIFLRSAEKVNANKEMNQSSRYQLTGKKIKNKQLIEESMLQTSWETAQLKGCNTTSNNRVWHTITFSKFRISNTNLNKASNTMRNRMILHTWPKCNNLNNNSNQAFANNTPILQSITQICSIAQRRILLRWPKTKILVQKVATIRYLTKMQKRENKEHRLELPTLFIFKKITYRRSVQA